MSKLLDCPRHEGAYDCTPFCDVCEGEQRYEWTPVRPCLYCDDAVDHDIWFEELGLCVACSNLFWAHGDDGHECSWACLVELPDRIRNMRKKIKGGV